MSELADWLWAQMKERGYNQAQTSVHAGVAGGTISDILTKDHIPRIEILFRLADHFGTDRIDIFQLTGHTPAPAPNLTIPITSSRNSTKPSTTSPTTGKKTSSPKPKPSSASPTAHPCASSATNPKTLQTKQNLRKKGKP